MRVAPYFSLFLLIGLISVPPIVGQIVQIEEDFSRDPGWDHYQNRIIGT
jgi:hypothetical protein